MSLDPGLIHEDIPSSSMDGVVHSNGSEVCRDISPSLLEEDKALKLETVHFRQNRYVDENTLLDKVEKKPKKTGKSKISKVKPQSKSPPWNIQVNM